MALIGKSKSAQENQDQICCQRLQMLQGESEEVECESVGSIDDEENKLEQIFE